MPFYGIFVVILNISIGYTGTALAVVFCMNHNENCKMAFGRPTKEEGKCPRCDELRNGAAPRKGWGAMKKVQEANRSAHIKMHYSSGECAKTCGSVCTKFDW